MNTLNFKSEVNSSKPIQSKIGCGFLIHGWLWVTIMTMVCDQVTKWMALKYLSLGWPQAVFPGFDLELRYNPGAAFSFLADASGWQRWLFVAIALIVSTMIYFWLRKLPATAKIEGIGLAFVLGGALGNLLDRVRWGYVVDFISIYIKKPDWVWPAFNIADSAICIGAVCIIFTLFSKSN